MVCFVILLNLLLQRIDLIIELISKLIPVKANDFFSGNAVFCHLYLNFLEKHLGSFKNGKLLNASEYSEEKFHTKPIS